MSLSSRQIAVQGFVPTPGARFIAMQGFAMVEASVPPNTGVYMPSWPVEPRRKKKRRSDDEEVLLFAILS